MSSEPSVMNYKHPRHLHSGAGAIRELGKAANALRRAIAIFDDDHGNGVEPRFQQMKNDCQGIVRQVEYLEQQLGQQVYEIAYQADMRTLHCGPTGKTFIEGYERYEFLDGRRELRDSLQGERSADTPCLPGS